MRPQLSACFGAWHRDWEAAAEAVEKNALARTWRSKLEAERERRRLLELELDKVRHAQTYWVADV
eukprot:6969505-Prymnesium_polylepis.1